MRGVSAVVKFRAWDKKKKEWADDIYIGSDGWHFQQGIDDHNPDIEIQLSTGLKDSKGVEIFEGDLLKSPIKINQEYHGDYCINEVMVLKGQIIASHVSSEKGKLPRGYTRGQLLESWFSYDHKLLFWGEDYEPQTGCEVIGNIHQNKELLEADNDSSS